MKRLLIILLVSILAVCSMAQGPSVHHNSQVLWVIDGLVMDTTTMTRGEFDIDSIMGQRDGSFVPFLSFTDHLREPMNRAMSNKCYTR